MDDSDIGSEWEPLTDGWGNGEIEEAGQDPERLKEGPDRGAANAGGPGTLDSARIYRRQAARYLPLGARDQADCSGPSGRTEETTASRTGPPPRAQDAASGERRRLVLGHLGLVIAIARHYRHPNLSLGDLIQEGNLGLIEAAARFDRRRGVRFAPFAAGHIRHAICRALSLKSRLIRIPLDRIILRRRAAIVAAELEQRCRNETCCEGRRHVHTTEDDAREMGVETERLQATMLLVPEVVSMDAPPDRDGNSLAATLSDDRAANPRDTAARAEECTRLQDALSALPDRLRRVVRMRYGLDGGEAATFAEIGRVLHLTPQRVHQLHRQALRRLRADLPAWA